MNRARLLTVALVLVVAGCGGTPSTSAGDSTLAPPSTSAETTSSTTSSPTTETPGEPTSTTADDGAAPGPIAVSEADLAQARAELDAARERWADAGPDDYVMTTFASCECLGWQVRSEVAGGEVVDHTVTTEIPGSEPGEVPRTVEDVFTRADELLSYLEANPAEVAPGECDGRKFHATFDGLTGLPETVGDNTPCDGGVDWLTTVEPTTG
ncbi:MAG: DUF6174 domain-containing protein [Actinomycetota bacterium]|nr:DUF6174 domain-containing protein [Actinomycetota bacterium]